MCVFHAAGFANGQAFTGSLQFFGAYVFFLARFQAFGCCFVGGRHGAVALDVFLGFFVPVSPGNVEGQQST